MLSKKANFSLSCYQLYILFTLVDDYLDRIGDNQIGLTESEIYVILDSLLYSCEEGEKLYFWVDDHEEQVE